MLQIDEIRRRQQEQVLAKPNLNLPNNSNKEAKSIAKSSTASSTSKAFQKDFPPGEGPLVQGGEDSSVEDKRDKIKAVSATKETKIFSWKCHSRCLFLDDETCLGWLCYVWMGLQWGAAHFSTRSLCFCVRVCLDGCNDRRCHGYFVHHGHDGWVRERKRVDWRVTGLRKNGSTRHFFSIWNCGLFWHSLHKFEWQDNFISNCTKITKCVVLYFRQEMFQFLRPTSVTLVVCLLCLLLREMICLGKRQSTSQTNFSQRLKLQQEYPMHLLISKLGWATHCSFFVVKLSKFQNNIP